MTILWEIETAQAGTNPAAYRIKYFLGGNSEPFLHAHKVARYMSKPDKFCAGGLWLYPKEVTEANLLNL